MYAYRVCSIDIIHPTCHFVNSLRRNSFGAPSVALLGRLPLDVLVHNYKGSTTLQKRFFVWQAYKKIPFV